MAQIVTITNPLTGQPAQVDQLEHTAQEIDDAIARALPGGGIDTLLAGKAPAGYGLGNTAYGTNAGTLANIDTYVENGWWRFDVVGTYDAIGVSANHSVLRVDAGRTIVQTLFLSSYDAVVTRRKIATESAWGEWEWVNPPMVVGTEYRTTERYLGKPVYAKLVDCGAGPNKARKTVSAGISNVDKAVSATGSWALLSIPYEFYSGDVNGAQAISVTLNGTSVEIASTVDYSTNTVYALIKYTKTTD